MFGCNPRSSWNNIQATLHPFVVYCRSDFVFESKSFVAISESLKHDTIAEEVGEISKIIYFSDGASSQYKNKKNFINLCYHEEDFGITAEWHFFATSHGKGPCDGTGGTLKRLAAKASLQRLDNQISTPNELFLWASENLHSKVYFKVHFFAEKDYAEGTMILKNRFATTKQIRGTLNYHSFIPVSKTKLYAILFSFSNSLATENVFK
ncbi:hypothetical protein J437_LFUL013615 [Ladona fulva]|uniref:Uncharacterized protein n=1 Tax=Ladona fulva TaxID=123851 RepID=A0A8K0P918_LADFU|nr:hypothetical protein J437_LFUL013615 [Ladona fulva]